jgi:hypothetical protein
MSLAAAFLLAAAVAGHAAPAEVSEPDHGAQVESARVSATILRAAVVAHGSLVSARDGVTPRSQRQSRGGRINYEFE